MIHHIVPTNIWNYLENEELAAFYLEEEWTKIGEYITQRIINDKKYIPFVYKLQKERGKMLVAISKEIRKSKLQNLDLNQLFAEYEKLEDAWIHFDHVNVAPWFIGGEYLQTYLRGQLEILGVPEKAIATLLAPSELSFSAEEELGILKIALKIKGAARKKKEQTIFDDSKKAIHNLVKKYHWIPFGYDGPDLYDFKYYEKAVLEITKNLKAREISQKIEKIEKYSSVMKARQEQIFAKYKLPKELIRQIKIIHVLAKMTDERKIYAHQAHIAFHDIIKNIARLLNQSPFVLKHVTLDEIRKHLDYPKKLIKLGEDRMKKPVLFHRQEGQLQIFVGKRAKKMFEKVMSEISGSDELTLKGNVGSKGSILIVKGIVRILMSPQEMDQLKDGEILVTAMTTPEYVPAMRRSLAIITDEGGVTCHAAIVSRELGKPAIIGTKIATKFLKNGEFIEIDMEKGQIRKLA